LRSASVVFFTPMAQVWRMTIDHDRRRQDIAAITIDLVAREGIEAATIRRIAAEAGFSTTAITSYFADKQELLAWAFEVLASEGERRFEEALAGDPSDILGPLLTMVPWCPVNVRRWKAYLAFWDQGARDAELAALLAQSTDAGLSFVQTLLRRKSARHADPETAARLLNALIQGLALQMLVDPAQRDEATVRAMLARAFDLALIMADRSPAGAGDQRIAAPIDEQPKGRGRTWPIATS
jgi:TetR/AcrR family transcriptional regulator, transcriptional repressor of bet genes